MDDSGRLAAAGADPTTELARLRAENEALRGRLNRRKAARRWLVHALVVLSALLVLASTVAVWAYRTAFDTDRFMTTVEPALDEPAFYSALSDRVSEQTLEALDLEMRVAGRLEQLDAFVSEAVLDAVDLDPQARQLLARFERPSLGALAPPIASALEDRVVRIVDRLITSEEFNDRLVDLVRQAHEAAVALVRDDTAELPNVYTAMGEVRLNLIPIIRDALSQLVDEARELLPDVELPEVISNRAADGRAQLGDALQTRLPQDFGQVTLMSEDSLSAVQQTLHRLDQFVWLLVIGTGGLIAAAIAASPARRRTVVQLGLGVVIGLILGAVAIRRLQASVLEEARTPDGERLAEALLDEAISSLRSVALIIGAVALIAAAVAHLADRPAWAVRLYQRGSQMLAASPRGRELDRRIAENYDLLRVVIIAVAVAVVFLIGFELIPVLIVAALLALLLWALADAKRRSARREPAAEPEDEMPTAHPH